MAEVVLFNHIPKTAGSTMKYVLWRNFGGEGTAFLMSDHAAGLAPLRERLEDERTAPGVVVAHTGHGLHERLPAGHDYLPFTLLREPLDRTVSAYFHIVDQVPIEIDLERFLGEEFTLQSFNAQTAFLAGLDADHHLDGRPLDRSLYDEELLERAKRNLAAHAVVGLTERFDETLLLLRDAYGWPLRKTLYRSTNVGVARRRAPLSAAEMEAVRANNELDLRLYAYATELFERRLAERAPGHAARLRRFHRVNAAYAAAYPIAYPPARALARGARRLRG
jgi:hypothetical protein